MSLSEKIIKKIEKEKIEPKSKWIFELKNISIWVLFALSLIIGSIAISLIIFILRNNDWDLRPHVGGLFKFVILTMPYLWIIILIVFVLFAYFELKNTKGGYRYNPFLIVLISVLISIILGSGLHVFGASRSMDDVLSKRMPLYPKMFFQKDMMWRMQSEGLLGGTIKSIKGEKEFEIEDLSGKNWSVTANGFDPVGGLVLEEGMEVKIIGEKVDDNTFKAYEIRPFFGPRNEVLKDQFKNFKGGERKFAPMRNNN